MVTHSPAMLFTALVLLIGLLPAATALAEPPSRGAVLSASCAGCHGTDGRSQGSIPPIYGRSADFIQTSLEDFRSGKRPSTVMGRHAKGYTEEEIALIAEYYASRSGQEGD
jgi:sulfide dehydrogenase cytochrome subunit